MSDPGDGRRALVVTAHPDDIEFGCAGTVARWTDEGWDVRYVIATSGQKGVQDARSDPEEFGRRREAEARRAAEICGVGDVTFLGYMDTELLFADGQDLRRALSRQFRLHRPQRLVTMEPELIPTAWFVNHPDHRALATAVLDVTVTGGTTAGVFPELVEDEGLEPWQELAETWLFGPGGGPTAVDVSSTIDRKLSALRAHASQVDEAHVEWIRDFIARWGREDGMAYAERFRVIRTLR